MAKVLQNIFNPGVDEVAQTYIIESWHVSQSVDALTGAEAYDISISGSLSLVGPMVQGDGTSFASGAFAHAEGNGSQAATPYTHAEGEATTAGSLGYSCDTPGVVAGVFLLKNIYGDVTAQFPYNEPIVFINNNIAGEQFVAAAAFVGGQTQITLQDSSLNDATTKFSIALPNEPFPINADQVLGDNSHTEGSTTYSYGSYSHAEGAGTYAVGNNSHAEGAGTTAQGQSSHAEGNATQAIGADSHAEGYITKATGDFSHAEGSTTTAQGQASHAEGTSTLASGDSSHAEGLGTVSSGYYSHAEGYYTLASGDNSHAEGYQTTASGVSAHAEGYQTVAEGNYQHTQGRFNISSSYESAFIIGNGISNASRSNLVFASGSAFQITGSAQITGSLYLNGNKQFNYGEFYTTSSLNIPYIVPSSSITFDVDNVTSGVSLVSNSRITVANPGFYNISVNAEVAQGTGDATCHLWIKKNGTNIANSAVYKTLPANTSDVLAFNFISHASNAGDYYEIVHNSNAANGTLNYNAASGSIPASPSILVTITQVS